MSVAVDSDAEDDAVSEIAEAAGVSPAPAKPSMSAPRRMLLFGLVVVVALAVLLCCWGFRVQRARHAQDQRGHFLQAARQCALNLTTIDWRNAEADVRRILDGATGEFYNDFAQRSQPFVEVLRHAKASTVGTITEAGLQTQTADTAQALVAVSVQTSNAGEADPVPRAWRMRITVQRVGDRVKVSDVGSCRELVAGDRLRAAARAGVGADVWRGLAEMAGRRRAGPRRGSGSTDAHWLPGVSAGSHCPWLVTGCQTGGGAAAWFGFDGCPLAARCFGRQPLPVAGDRLPDWSLLLRRERRGPVARLE